MPFGAVFLQALLLTVVLNAKTPPKIFKYTHKPLHLVYLAKLNAIKTPPQAAFTFKITGN